MELRKYLPSVPFVTVVASTALAVGLIYAATQIKNREKQTETGDIHVGISAYTKTSQQNDWLSAFSAVQTRNDATSTTNTTAEELRQSVQSTNLTDSVSRTLLINLAEAQSQGYGADSATQEQIVQHAISQANSTPPKNTYAEKDIVLVADSAASLRTYGNATIAVLSKHSGNNVNKTVITLGLATDKNDPSQLDALQPIEDSYRAQTRELAALPVPRSLAMSHLQLINSLSQISDTYSDMKQILTDPLRGLSGMQQYRALGDITWQVFINIAQTLAKNGILFNKDEPGATWQLLVSQ